MQHKLLLMASCALLLVAAGCKEKNKPQEQITANIATPVWVAPADYDMTSSMTAVVRVDLSQKYAEQLKIVGYAQTADDLLAAFNGNDCLGVAKQQDGLFYLFITSPATTGEGKVTDFTIRYYSAKLKNIFESESFAYYDDGTLGNIGTPCVPVFRIAK